MDPADYNFDHPASIDFELLSQHVAALRRGEDIEVGTRVAVPKRPFSALLGAPDGLHMPFFCALLGRCLRTISTPTAASRVSPCA